MAAVLGYVVVATIAVALALRIAGPRWTVRRDPTFELEDVAGRLVGAMSGLAGFAVAGLVFLESAMVLVGFLLLAVVHLV
jgi:hypothetical protein